MILTTKLSITKGILKLRIVYIFSPLKDTPILSTNTVLLNPQQSNYIHTYIFSVIST